jgi:uncharacterized protein involved in high-affinity Fe2+ transport
MNEREARIARSLARWLLGLTATGLLTLPALGLDAAEVGIGKPKVMHGMKLAAVYLQAVPWEPTGESWGPPPEQSDVHLEADVSAVKGNRHGFAPGAWIPALTIRYTLVHESGARQEGHLFPMVAKDGPHYGVNVKLPGRGRYTLTLLVQPPELTGFGRHPIGRPGSRLGGHPSK